MRFIKDTVITFSTRMAVVVLALIAAIVIARVLGPSGKGAYELIILVPAILALVGTLGIGIANTYFIGSKKYNLDTIATNSVFAALGLGLLFTGAFLAYYYYFQPSFLSGTPGLCVTIAVAVLPLLFLGGYLSNVLLGLRKFSLFNAVTLIRGAVTLAFVLVLLLGIKAGILGATLAYVMGGVSAAILSFVLVRQLTKFRFSFDRRVFADSVRFGSQGYLGNAIQFLNYRLDMFLVAFFMNVAFVGYYSVAVAIAEALWYFPGAVGTAIFAHTASLSAEEANRATPRICRNTLFLTAVAAGVLFALGYPIIRFVFGAPFLPALTPMWVLLPGVVALSIYKVLANEMGGRGKPIILTIAAAISLAVNIPLNLLLIPTMGITGAALASTISYSICALVVLIAFGRISRVSWVDTIFLKREDIRIYVRILTRRQSLSPKYWLNLWRS